MLFLVNNTYKKEENSSQAPKLHISRKKTRQSVAYLCKSSWASIFQMWSKVICFYCSQTPFFLKILHSFNNCFGPTYIQHFHSFPEVGFSFFLKVVKDLLKLDYHITLSTPQILHLLLSFLRKNKYLGLEAKLEFHIEHLAKCFLRLKQKFLDSKWRHNLAPVYSSRCNQSTLRFYSKEVAQSGPILNIYCLTWPYFSSIASRFSIILAVAFALISLKYTSSKTLQGLLILPRSRAGELIWKKISFYFCVLTTCS